MVFDTIFLNNKQNLLYEHCFLEIVTSAPLLSEIVCYTIQLPPLLLTAEDESLIDVRGTEGQGQQNEEAEHSFHLGLKCNAH